MLSGDWGTVQVILQSVSFHDLVTTDFNTTLGHAGPLQMWLVGLSANYPDPYNWLNGVFAPTAPLNVFNYRDDTTQFNAWAIMQQADQQSDLQKRLDLYHQAEQQLVNAALEIPYAQDKGVWRVRSYIQGFNPSALQTISDLDWANIVVLAH